MNNNYQSLGKVKTGLTVIQSIFIFGMIYSLINLIAQWSMSNQSMVAEGENYTMSMWDQVLGCFMQFSGYLGTPGSLLFAILAFWLATILKGIVGRLDQHEPLYSIENAKDIKQMSVAALSIGAIGTIFVLVGVVATFVQQRAAMEMATTTSTVYVPHWYDSYQWVFRSEISGGLSLILGYIGLYLALQGVAAFFMDKSEKK